MDSERATKDFSLNEIFPTKRKRARTISEHPNLCYSPCEEKVSQPQQQCPVVDDILSSTGGLNMLSLPHPATIHAFRPRNGSFLGDLFTLAPPATIHARSSRKKSFLDELPLSELGRLQTLSRQVSATLPPDPLMSERMMRMQLLDKYLSERGADLVTTANVPSTSFFKLAFHNHLIDELKKMSDASDHHWFYWYLHILFKYTGLKHFALCLLLVSYTMLGSFIFVQLEYRNERETTISTSSNVLAEITAFASTINQSRFLSQAELVAQVTEFYRKTTDIDGLVSNIDRLDDDKATWNFETGTFYAMTLLSTIGYGTIACKTAWGKAVTIMYVTIGLPLMLIVLRDLGHVLFVALQKGYSRFQAARKAQETTKSKEDLEPTFPLLLALLMVYIYLMIMTLLVFFFDEEEATAGSSGLSLGNCFYFSFISLTTIGLGDVMPNNIHYSPAFAGVFLSGLALISIVNTATYARIERKYFSAMSALEHVLVELEVDKHEEPKPKRVASKQPIFHELINIVRLAALIIPNLDSQLGIVVAKAMEETKDDQQPTMTTLVDTTSSSFNGICHSGWTGLRNSVRDKFKSLSGESNNNIVPVVTINSPPPSISLIVEKELCEPNKQLEKRFTVSRVSDD